VAREPFKIEKGIPVPESAYRWEDMQVGDSVFFADTMAYKRAASAAIHWAKRRRDRGGTIKFTVSRERRRIWRIA